MSVTTVAVYFSRLGLVIEVFPRFCGQVVKKTVVCRGGFLRAFVLARVFRGESYYFAIVVVWRRRVRFYCRPGGVATLLFYRSSSRSGDQGTARSGYRGARFSDREAAAPPPSWMPAGPRYFMFPRVCAPFYARAPRWVRGSEG